jgi:hypothetical protein
VGVSGVDDRHVDRAGPRVLSHGHHEQALAEARGQPIDELHDRRHVPQDRGLALLEVLLEPLRVESPEGLEGLDERDPPGRREQEGLSERFGRHRVGED